MYSPLFFLLCIPAIAQIAFSYVFFKKKQKGLVFSVFAVFFSIFSIFSFMYFSIFLAFPSLLYLFLVSEYPVADGEIWLWKQCFSTSFIRYSCRRDSNSRRGTCCCENYAFPIGFIGYSRPRNFTFTQKHDVPGTTRFGMAF